MNFDDGDDPLADLSDGSNDSFFDYPKGSASAKRASLTIKTPDKKTVTELFKPLTTTSAEKKQQQQEKIDDWLGLDSLQKKPPTPKLGTKKKISFDDDGDILGILSKPATPMAEKAVKKNDFLESILGPSKIEGLTIGAETGKNKTTFDDILKDSKARSVLSEAGPSNVTISEAATPPAANREGRRGRRLSGGLMDPLGLFGTKDDLSSVIKSPIATQSTPNIASSAAKDEALPDWLGGGSSLKGSRSETVIHKSEATTSENVATINLPEPREPDNKVADPENIQFGNNTDVANFASLITQQKLAQSQLEYQNTAIALQQQESQLLASLQLKKYEDNLFGMQRKQQDVLTKQEQQFNVLLERQFAKQQIMENNMRLQQERINNHIQMLIGQPPVTIEGEPQSTDFRKTASEENVKIYENMIETMKQRQHEEMFILEESYKKQLDLMQQSLEAIEKRLKMDSDKLSDHFQSEIEKVNQKHADEIAKYKDRIQNIESDHAIEISNIRESHLRVVDEIKSEYGLLVDNLKLAKQSETSIFSDSNAYFQKLDSNIEILYTNSKSLLEIKERVEKDYGILSQAREESLKAKENEISMMRETLEKSRENAERERAELMGLVRTLETKISEQNQNSREERWAFQQATMTLAARSAALDRETEFNRTSLEREREQLKTLKESMLAEQEKTILHLTEEKLALSAERSRLETTQKLNQNYDPQRAKSEIEAAIQVAKEAATMTDKERESLTREKCEVEKLKRVLVDQERKLRMREMDLDEIKRESEEKMVEGERALLEAKNIEIRFNQRLKDLQNQLHTLSNREKKLAEEKIALSKERLILNTMARQMKKCALCTADKFNTGDIDQSPAPRLFQTVDRDIIRLRFEATQDDLNQSEHDEDVPT